MQSLVVVGVPFIVWRYAAMPTGLVRRSNERPTVRWLPCSSVFPLAIMQIFVGVLLGPSVFGRAWQEGFALLFRTEVRQPIETIGNIAIVLLVFIAGCETDRAILKGSAGTLLKVGVCGVLAPWAFGLVAAFALATLFPRPDVIGTLGNTVLFAFAFGTCMSVTALPILLLLCREMDILRQPIGSVALAIAGISDLLLWLAVALLLPFATAGSGVFASLLLAAGGGVALIGALLLAISPYLARQVRKGVSEGALLTASVLVLLASALTADLIGLHAVIGAFIAGLLLPDEIRTMAKRRLDMPVSLILMPFFFLSTGLRTEFSFTDPTVWVIVSFGFVASTAGKLIGVSLPIRLSGQSGPFSTMLGILMQCKGLMEILVVSVLRERGIVGDLVFSALVVVAMISNAVTSPLVLLWIRMFGPSAYEGIGALRSSLQPRLAEATAGAGPLAADSLVKTL